VKRTKLTREELRELEQLLPSIGVGFRRRRGRPPGRYAKAFSYDQQVIQLTLCGMGPTEAVREVAFLNNVTPEHIWACRKFIATTDHSQYLECEYDPVEATWPD